MVPGRVLSTPILQWSLSFSSRVSMSFTVPSEVCGERGSGIGQGGFHGSVSAAHEMCDFVDGEVDVVVKEDSFPLPAG